VLLGSLEFNHFLLLFLTQRELLQLLEVTSFLARILELGKDELDKQLLNLRVQLEPVLGFNQQFSLVDLHHLGKLLLLPLYEMWVLSLPLFLQ